MIKNILVPTDFSPNAHTAARQAAVIARHAGARLLLFHALYPLVDQDSCQEEDPEMVAQTKLDALALELHSDVGVSVTRLLKPGFALEEIDLLAGMLHADVVIMGAQGVNAQEHKTLGQIARARLLASDIPLICIAAGTDLSSAVLLRKFLVEGQKFCNEGGLRLLNRLVSTIEGKTVVPVKKEASL